MLYLHRPARLTTKSYRAVKATSAVVSDERSRGVAPLPALAPAREADTQTRSASTRNPALVAKPGIRQVTSSGPEMPIESAPDDAVDHLREARLLLDDLIDAPTFITTAATGAEPSAGSAGTGRFSSALIEQLRQTMASGHIEPHELRTALSGAEVLTESDILRVAQSAIVFKRTIAALGAEAKDFLGQVGTHSVAILLKSWCAEKS